jgi:hypothetical protein
MHVLRSKGDRKRQADLMNIDDIRAKLSSGNFEFSRHAFRRAVERNISEAEIRELSGAHPGSGDISNFNKRCGELMALTRPPSPAPDQ